MYKVVYYLVNGSTVAIKAREPYGEDIERFILKTQNVITAGGTVQVENQTPNGFREVTIINAKNIIKVVCTDLTTKLETAIRSKNT